MAPPIYFFPRTRLAQLVVDDRLNPELLVPRGLGKTFSDVESVRKDCSCFELTGIGPGDSSGCLLTALPVDPQRKPIRLTFEKKFQTWRRFGKGSTELWIGIDKEHPIEPEDLQRKRMVDGYRVELAGRPWQIPILRDPEGGSSLPNQWEVDADGTVRQAIRQEYRQLWDDFGQVVDVFFSQDDPAPPGILAMERDRAMYFCLTVLKQNYRVDRYVQNLLHLVDGDTWQPILSCACDLPTFYAAFEEAQSKKKARQGDPGPGPDSTDTPPGPEASCPTTDPAAASSPPAPAASDP